MNKIKDYYRDRIEEDMRKAEKSYHGDYMKPHKRSKSDPEAIMLAFVVIMVMIVAFILFWLSKEALLDGIMKIVAP